ncbi:HAD family hydrolase [Streptomyces sp. NPDC059491]|uniref:HAD family hydrolase n=1 Tax=Streptomyces sp. NPDC059491 TaxID=3346850 RepID=UPI0036A0171A
MTRTPHPQPSGRPRTPGDSRPAVVVTDLDGTLLRADATVGERTLAALRATAAAGTRIVFATARPAWSARAVLAGASGLGALLVSSNGALVSELDSGRVRRVRAMSPATVRAALAEVSELPDLPGLPQQAERAEPMEPAAADGSEESAGSDGSDGSDGSGLPRRPVWAVDREHDRLLGPGWPDVLASGPAAAGRVHAVPDDLPVLCLMVHLGAGRRLPALGVRGAVRWTSSAPGLLEISAPEADKVSAVACLLEETGVGWDRVLAFGDAPNDAGLLTAAGTGVAVANAAPEVSALADAVTGHHDEEGVARWLEAMCPDPR